MDIMELLRIAESQAIAKANGGDFYIQDTQRFFQEFKKNVLGRFKEEQSAQDIYNLTQPDYLPIFLIFKKYSYIMSKTYTVDDFVMRFIYALESIEETFSIEANKKDMK